MRTKRTRILIKAGIALAGLASAGLIVLVVWLQLQHPEKLPLLNTDQTVEATTTGPTLPPPPANVFDPADFVYDEQGYLTCTAGPYERGIDVSHHQNNIDWKKVADSGVTFVIIRAAGRGYGETGNLYPDRTAQDNYKAAKKAGLKIGAYIFSQATTPEEAVEEAEYLLAQTKDWELDLPLIYDWEYISDEARTANVDRQTLTDCMIAFCDRIAQEGKEPMIYFNPSHAEKYFHIEQVKDYPFWLAMYTDWMTFPYKFNMWQYTNQGTVPGIKGNVDINLLFSYE